MLVLTRRRGESVDLVERHTQTRIATVKVISVVAHPSGLGHTVHLGFDAPDTISILRDDIKTVLKDETQKETIDNGNSNESTHEN